MTTVRGSEGYERSIQKFIELSQALRFEEVCKDFLGFLPAPPCRILDAGSGAGQNAAALAEMGHSVVAVEPLDSFRESARIMYSHQNILWLDDSLPELKKLHSDIASFEFILVDGVWHHLTKKERDRSLERFSQLLNPGGRCALSLRTGPPGLGTCVYPTDARDTIRIAKEKNLACLLLLEDQPSILAGKEDVKWSRIVLQKIA